MSDLVAFLIGSVSAGIFGFILGHWIGLREGEKENATLRKSNGALIDEVGKMMLVLDGAKVALEVAGETLEDQRIALKSQDDLIKLQDESIKGLLKVLEDSGLIMKPNELVGKKKEEMN